MLRISTIICTICVLIGCAPSPEKKISEQINKDPSALEFGWKLREIKEAEGKYYAYVVLPPAFNASYKVQQMVDEAVQRLCPAGENDLVEGDFWKGESRLESFKIIAEGSDGNVISRIECTKDYSPINDILKASEK